MMKKTPSTDWLLEVSSARELGVIRDAEHGPMVAFADLCLPYGARSYLGGLDFTRDFSKDAPVAQNQGIKRSLKLNHGNTEYNFNIDGWHANPDQSRLAEKRFAWLAAPFFPEHTHKKQLLSSLAHRFAEVASALDRKRLTFTLRAIGPGMENYIHFDSAYFTTIAYLRGATTQHINYTPETLAEMANWQPDPEQINHTLPRDQYKNLAEPRPQTIAAWRGSKAGKPSLHGRINLVRDLRIVCIATVHGDDMTPAYTEPPTAAQKLADFQNSRHFG